MPLPHSVRPRPRPVAPPPHLARSVAAELAAKIRAGEIPPGSFIPSVRALSDGAHEGLLMANRTGARVHELLRASGLVESTAGLGTTVLDPSRWPTV